MNYSLGNNLSRSGAIRATISGFAYPANTLTSTRTGQWFVNGIAQVGETGTSFVVPFTAIGALIQQANSNALTCWHPNQIAAVARFRAAIFGNNTLSGISPDVPAANGAAIRRVVGLISGDFADQATAAFQPIYRTAGQAGLPSWEFDGADDLLSLPANSDVFQARTQSYLIAGVRDTVPNGGAAAHTAIIYQAGATAFTRIGLQTRSGANQMQGIFRRLDGDNITFAPAANNGNYNVLAAHGDWSNGFGRLRVNGVVAVSSALPSGSGPTSNTISQAPQIGNGLPGHITCLCEINAAISPTDLSRIERYMGLLGGLTTIPLV